jgi:hypothetical protein
MTAIIALYSELIVDLLQLLLMISCFLLESQVPVPYNMHFFRKMMIFNQNILFD